MKLASMRILSIFFFVVTLGFVAASCSSLNDPTPDGNGTNITYVGIWRLVKSAPGLEVNDNPPSFTLNLKEDGSFIINNPTGYVSPANEAEGQWSANRDLLSFTPGFDTRATVSGNSLTLEWEVSKPGKPTVTYRFFFERN